jgi:hypothetical protein
MTGNASAVVFSARITRWWYSIFAGLLGALLKLCAERVHNVE